MRPIKIGKKDYIISYSINALVRMEKETGKTFEEIFPEDKFSLMAIRDLFYYGLIEKQTMTPEKAGDLLEELIQDGEAFEDIMGILMEELAKAIGADLEENSPNE